MIWIEILSRQREVLARHRIEGDRATIGRGYGNDVVLDDPHVAAEHLLVTRDADGRLVAEDRGSLNGLALDGAKTREGRLMLDGDQALRIGQTWLRIRDERYAVAPERPVVERRPHWPLQALLAVIIIAIELVGAWRGDFREVQAMTYLQPVLIVVVLVAVWSGIWILLSRLLARAARFEIHLLLGLAAMLAISVGNEITDFAAFAFSVPWLSDVRLSITVVVLGVAAFLHMRAIGPTRLPLKLAGTVVAAAAVLGYQAVSDADTRRTQDPPTFVHLLFPPAFRLSPLKSEVDFLDDLKRMRTGLEQERTKISQ